MKRLLQTSRPPTASARLAAMSRLSRTPSGARLDLGHEADRARLRHGKLLHVAEHGGFAGRDCEGRGLGNLDEKRVIVRIAVDDATMRRDGVLNRCCMASARVDLNDFRPCRGPDKQGDNDDEQEEPYGAWLSPRSGIRSVTDRGGRRYR